MHIKIIDSDKQKFHFVVKVPKSQLGNTFLIPKGHIFVPWVELEQQYSNVKSLN